MVADLQSWRASKSQCALRDRGIDEAQAANLQGRLKTIAEDWQRPEMDVYDEL